ncbi:cyclin-P3-1 isoform X2 [Spinacia oleracea]|nr:cyclin-P3-1-like isoform X2 [Spinacia oleracea]XP_056693935.1 cyclin-P3-1-like isoform X2 [Spinacia oleracea]XP_056693936.1 cyclin-P3-1-like isoform X2 [Spinacia oleracea]
MPMPQQKPLSETRISSESLCLKIGALAFDSDDAGTDIYLKLGLNEKGKGVLRTPRFLSLLSSLLDNCVQKNNMLLETAQIEDVLTVFHGSRAPPVSIQQYFDRMFKYAGCSPSCFIVAYIYVDRYLQQTKTYLTSLNVHRLLVASVMVAAKFVDDASFNNAYYAKVGGISTSEMNRLEMKLLFTIDFRLQVNVDTFRRYCLLLEKEDGGCQIDWPIKTCWVKESWSRNGEYPDTSPVAR